MGTSRNTGSDKQPYYKLTMTGDTGDLSHGNGETSIRQQKGSRKSNLSVVKYHKE